MTEEILVFKGDKVVYDSYYGKILCISRDDCFLIEDVLPVEIMGVNTVETIYPHGAHVIRGKELWSDGEKWIIKG